MNKQRRKSGFTLIEFVIVVAIIGILSAVAFVGVVQYQRNMNYLERDAVAKELFIAAQNHLTMAQNEGYLGLSEELDNPSTTVFGYLGTATADTTDESNNTVVNKTIYYLAVNEGRPDNPNFETMFNMMLPYGSIDEQVRSKGSYVIRYQPSTGLVLDVFYCSTPGTDYGYKLVDSLYNDLMADLRDDKDESGRTVNKQSTRRNYDKYKDASGKAIAVGWYGGEKAAETATGERLEMPEMVIENGDRLIVKVSDMNPTISDEQISVVVTGKVSGAKKVYLLKNPGSDSNRITSANKKDAEGHDVLDANGNHIKEYTLVLDDVTSPNKHFAEIVADTHAQNIDFLPGEDIEIQTMAFNNNALTNIASTEVQTTNSLFEKTEFVKKDPGIAINKEVDYTQASINSMRHLLNLNPSVSGVVADGADGYKSIFNPETASNKEDLVKVTYAVQTTDLNWDNYIDSVCAAKADGSSAIHVYKKGETSSVDGDNLFVPIETVYTRISESSDPIITYPLNYDGDGHSISKIKVETVGNAGLFGAVGKEGVGNESYISDLVLIDCDVKSYGASGNAGALAANLVNTNVTNVLAYNTPEFDKDTSGNAKVTVMANGSAGGLVGAMAGGSIRNSAAALVVNGATNAGGLIGMAGEALTGTVNAENQPNVTTGAVSVAYSYAGGHTVDVYATDASGNRVKDEHGNDILIRSAYDDDNFNVGGAQKVDGNGNPVTNAAGGATNAGGLIGLAKDDTTVVGSYSTASASGVNAGGLIGAIEKKGEGDEAVAAVVAVNDSYATGLVEGVSDASKAGAFLGGANGLASTSANNYYVGGVNGKLPADALEASTPAGTTYAPSAAAFGSTTKLAPDGTDAGTDLDPLPGADQTDKWGAADPYSSTLLTTYQGKFPYLNVDQMPAYTADVLTDASGNPVDENGNALGEGDERIALYAATAHLSRHYGDWAKEVLDTTLAVDNSDTLTAKVSMPIEQVWDDCEIPMIIKGESSKQETYLLIALEKVVETVGTGESATQVEKLVPRIRENSIIPGVTHDKDGNALTLKDATGNNVPPTGEGYADLLKEVLAQWQTAANLRLDLTKDGEPLETGDTPNTYTLALDLDNIASPNGHFTQLFPDYIPGENLIIAADGGYKSPTEMEATVAQMEAAIADGSYTNVTHATVDEYTADDYNKIKDYDSNGVQYARTMACRTNSLYADPAYRDMNGADVSGTDISGNNAGVSSIRHLENLDADISNVGKNDSATAPKVSITNATQIDDVDWTKFVENVGTKDPDDATAEPVVTIYTLDATGQGQAGPENSYIPVTPSHYNGTSASGTVETNVLNYAGILIPQKDADGNVVNGDDGNPIMVYPSIKGVSVNLTGADADGNPYGGNAGLFGKLSQNADGTVHSSVANIQLVDMVVKTQATTDADGNPVPAHAGALAGETVGTNITNVLVYNSDNTLTENISTTGGNAGGLVGDMTGGSVDASGAAVYVSAAKGTASASTYGNAGGLIGAVRSDTTQPDETTTITNSYSGGHTVDGAYAHDASGNLIANVQSSGANAGGLVGIASGTTNIEYCYATASAGTSTTGTASSVTAGGLIGKVGGETTDKVTADYCYALGETSAPSYTVNNKTTSNEGALIGSGTITYNVKDKDGHNATDEDGKVVTDTLTPNEARYNHTINVDVDALTALMNLDISIAANVEKFGEAMPYDTSTAAGRKSTSETPSGATEATTTYYYDYPTVAQLHALNPDDTYDVANGPDAIKSHHGDWPVEKIAVETDLKLNNGDILQAQVDITEPQKGDKKQLSEGQVITMLIGGDSSGEAAYLSFVVGAFNETTKEYEITLMDNSVIPGITSTITTSATGETTETPLTPTALRTALDQWAAATKLTLKSDGNGTAALTLNLDDITRAADPATTGTLDGHFASLFPTFIPGENISVAAKGCEQTQTEMETKFIYEPDSSMTPEENAAAQKDFENGSWTYTPEGATGPKTLAARTNSLFADPVKKDDQGNDLTNGTDLSNHEAGIASIRHLENLDASISSLGKNDSATSPEVTITNATQIADVDWNSFVTNVGEDRTVPAPTEENPNATTTNKVASIVKADGSQGPDNSYIPVTPSRYDATATSTGNISNQPLTYNGQSPKTDADGLIEYDENNNNATTPVDHKITGIVIDVPSGDAGLFGALDDGSSVSNLQLVNMQVTTKDGNAGAVAGTVTGTEIKNVLVYNDSTFTGTTNITTSGGNAGGLVGDMTGGKISESAAAVYVSATAEQGDNDTVTYGNAGGLVGASSADSSGEKAKIENSYSGGHTTNGKYDPNHPDVQSNGANAGGLIGNASGTEIEYCYSTSSASADGQMKDENGDNTFATDVNAGGLIGNSDSSVEAKYSYALGDTSATTGTGHTANEGALIGDGTLTNKVTDKTLTEDEAKYTHVINVNASAVDAIASTVKDTATGDHYVESDAEPYDNTLGDTYDHPTVFQLHELEAQDNGRTLADDDPIKTTTSPAVNTHYGDWPTEKITVDTDLTIHNGDILYAQVDMPKAQVKEGQVVTMLISGDSSGEKTNLQIVFEENSSGVLEPRIMDNSYIVGVTVNPDGTPITIKVGNTELDPTSDEYAEKLQQNIQAWQDATKLRLEPTIDGEPLATGQTIANADTYSLKINLDDITTDGGHFAQLFPEYIPGENITIAAKGNEQTKDQMEKEFIYDSSNTTLTQSAFENTYWTYTPEGATKPNTLAGRTNSLFADATDSDNDGVLDNAEITSIRHLENLDASISNVGKNDDPDDPAINITNATQTDDVSWTDFRNNVAENEDTDGHIHVYKVDGTEGPADSYIPVKPSHYDNAEGTSGDNDHNDDVIETNPLNFTSVPKTDENGDTVTGSDGKPVYPSITGVNIDLPSGNAGLFDELSEGSSVSNVTLVDMVVSTDDGNAGAIAGTVTGTDITNVVVTNSSDFTGTDNITATNGNAGGIVGEMNGGTISESAASVYVDADKGISTDGGNAGGLVGETGSYVNDDGDTVRAVIRDSYTGGHTNGSGAYDPNNPNVQSDGGSAGGLIGNATNTDVEYCYSTCSAGSDEAAGGLIGSGDTSVYTDYCYAIGDTFDTDPDDNKTTDTGALVGSGTVSYVTERNADGTVKETRPQTEDEATYSHAINLDADAVDNVDNGLTSEKTENKDDAVPYDTTGHHQNTTNTDGKYDYDHPTVSQLHELAGTTPPTSETTKSHIGDWPAAKLGIDTDLSLNNGDILQAQVDMPASDVAVGKIITMLVRGESSDNSNHDKDVYLSFVVTEKNTDGSYAVKLMDTSVIPGWTDSNDPTKTVEAWQTAAKATTITVSGSTASLKVDLDDITTPDGHFAQLFPNLIPGENIDVIAKGSEKTKDALALELTNKISSPGWDNKNEIDVTNAESTWRQTTTLAARTNSLYADPVVYDENGIAITNGTDLASHNAGISSIRHLENLDADISHVGANNPSTPAVSITDATQIGDVDWDDFKSNVTGGSGDVRIYAAEPEMDGDDPVPLATNSYVPVTPSHMEGTTPVNNSLTYSGQSPATDANGHIVRDENGATTPVTHDIKDIVIDIPSGDAGLFGELSNGSSVSNVKLTDMTVTTGSDDTATTKSNAGAIAGTMTGTTVTDVTLENPTITSHNGNAGAIAGTTEKTNITDALVYNTPAHEAELNERAENDNVPQANITAENGHAGGLVGEMKGGKIDESGAAVYVNSDKTDDNDTNSYSAGGLVGKASADSDGGRATIEDSYTGGHTAANTPIDVRSDSGSAGGLIGSATNTDIDYCYSTSDAGSPTAAGGLIGSSDNTVTVDEVYALGDAVDTSDDHSGSTGTLIGSGTAVNDETGEELSEDKAQYSHSVNVDIDAVDDISQIKKSNGTNYTDAVATPYNRDDLDNTYDHPTINQLHELDGTPAPTSDTTKTHVGDWPTEKLSRDTDLILNNGDILQAQVDIKEDTPLQPGQIITMVIRGDSSGAQNETYLSVVVTGAKDAQGNYPIKLMDTSVIPGITTNKTGDDLRDALDAWATATKLSLKSGSGANAGTASLTIDLDDITTENGHFAQLFPKSIPGENISVIARGSEKTKDTLDAELTNATWTGNKVASDMDNWKGDGKTTLAAKTNSLFASVTDSDGNGSADKAEITSIRHLENLDSTISHVGANDPEKNDVHITKANQTDDVDWNEFVNTVTGGNTTETVNVYTVDENGTGHAGPDNSYIPVTPSNYNTGDDVKNGLEYTGVHKTDDEGNETDEYPSITGINIDLPSGDAGLFGELSEGSSVSHVTLTDMTVSTGSDDTATTKSNAGAIAGTMTGTTVTDVTLENPTITSHNGNAGGIAGTTTGGSIEHATITDPTIASTDGNAGALAGTTTGTTITDALAYDKNNTGTTNITANNGNAGGLVGDMTGGSINESGAAVYVKTDGTNGGDAGGLVGAVKTDSNNGTATITNSYSGGHDGSTPNVQSTNGSAGGLIGSTSGTGTTSVDYCYSTSSADATGTNTDVSAGGLIGQVDGNSATADHSYALGTVTASTSGTDDNGDPYTADKGTLIGDGTVPALSSDQAQYSHTINLDADKVGNIGTSNYTDADPYHGTGHPSREDEDGNTVYQYDHPTVAQLYDIDNVDGTTNKPDATSAVANHHGDWPVNDLGIDTDLKLKNEDILQAQVDMPKDDVKVGQIITMLIQGDSSGKETYLSYVVTNKNADGTFDVTLMNNSVIPGWTGTAAEWQAATKSTKITVSGNTASLKVDLDDISTPNGHFTQLFPNYIPGENITVIARGNEKTQSELRKELTDNASNWQGNRIPSDVDSWQTTGEKTTLAAKTNSLYADPVIVEGGKAVTTGTNLANGEAGISSIRHLENLDASISHVGENNENATGTAVSITKATQIDNVDWDDFKSTVTGGSGDVKIYSANPALDGDGNPIPLSTNSYVPVMPSHYEGTAVKDTTLTYNGQSPATNPTTGRIDETADPVNHTISNVIVNATSGNAGLFDTLKGGKVENVQIDHMTATAQNGSAGTIAGVVNGGEIKNVKLVDPKVYSTGGNAGAVAGTTTGTKIEGVEAYNSSASVTENIKATGGNAGGLVGDMSGGSIEESAASVYVEATKPSGSTANVGNAGGLVGATGADSSGNNAKIEDSYSAGHTSNGAYTGTPNVKSEGASAGGLIGSAANTDIDYCYSTSSAGSDTVAGGLIGSSNSTVSANHVYALGDTIDTTDDDIKTNTGAMIGNGTVTTDKANNKTLTGDEADYAHSIGVDIDAVDDVTSANLTEAGATTYDTSLGSTYDHPTVEQMHALAGDTGYTSDTDVVKTHHGDWPNDSLNRDTDLKLNNGDILQAQVDIDETTPLQVGQIITMLIRGDTSGEETYLSFVVTGEKENGEYPVKLMDNSVIPGWPSTSTVADWADAANMKLVSNGSGKAALTINLDDITTPDGHFTQLFPNYIPGEDISVIARGTAKTKDALSEDLPAADSTDWVNDEIKFSGKDDTKAARTNSLFADISDNDTAEITSIRHLENLDSTVSHLDKNDSDNKLNITKINQTANLIWTDSDASTKDFVQNIKEAHGSNVAIHVYPLNANSTAGTATEDNSYKPVTPSHYTSAGADNKAIMYNGESTSITGVVVNTTGNGDEAGLFGTLPGGSNVSNLTLDNFDINGSGTNTNAGVLAGKIGDNSSSSATTISGVTVNNPKVTTTGTGSNAGGLAGTAENATITGAKVDGGTDSNKGKVTATNGDAGGLIGEVNGTDTNKVTITNAEVVDMKVESNGTGGGNATDGNAGGLIATAKNAEVTNALVHNDQKDSATEPTVKASADSGTEHNDGNAGGLIGYAEDTSVNKSAAAVIVDSAQSNAGGLIGTANGGSVSGSYAGGHTESGAYSVTDYNVTATSGSAGGLIGETQGTTSIDKSYATTSAKGDTAGGLVGKATGTNAISDAYATGLVSGTTVGTVAGAVSDDTSFEDVLYYEIINDLSGMKPVAGAADTVSGISALDETLSSYNSFVGDSADWAEGHPYDSTLGTTYGNKYNLKTVQQLGETSVSATDYVDDHYGDWPSPETMVINTSA